MSKAGSGVAYAFWERIEREQYAQGLTQREVVKRSGIPASTINNLKDSTRPPQPRIVHAIADALGIDRDEAAQLAGRSQTPTPPADLDDDYDEVDFEIEMIRASNLPRTARESMIQEALRLRDRQASERRELRERQTRERRDQVAVWIDLARKANPSTT